MIQKGQKALTDHGSLGKFRKVKILDIGRAGKTVVVTAEEEDGKIIQADLSWFQPLRPGQK